MGRNFSVWLKNIVTSALKLWKLVTFLYSKLYISVNNRTDMKPVRDSGGDKLIGPTHLNNYGIDCSTRCL